MRAPKELKERLARQHGSRNHEIPASSIRVDWPTSIIGSHAEQAKGNTDAHDEDGNEYGFEECRFDEIGK